ncbi:putative pseudouridine transporter, partial [Dissostichus eleginoides]
MEHYRSYEVIESDYTDAEILDPEDLNDYHPLTVYPALLLRVIIHPRLIQKVQLTEVPESVEDLQTQLREKLGLKEPGSGTGHQGWTTSIKYKLGNYRSKLRQAGCNEVSVNHHYNDDSLEEHRGILVTEMKKRSKDVDLIRSKMDLTFSLRRKEVVEVQAMVTEIQERWPALFLQEQKTQQEPPGTFDMKVLDGAAVVHFLSTTNITTFDEYASCVFGPDIMKLLKTSERVDVVWDTYITRSIKESTREKRGKGIRRKVAGQNKLPRNWPDFLRDPMNKQELFTFLSSKIASIAWPVGKQVFITSDVRVVGTDTTHFMLPCNHEEADTRIMIHLHDALEHGSSTCLYPAADIWVAFGTGKNYTYHHINTICHTLGKDRSTALPVFHCCTGCDTTSAFCGKGK